MDKQSKLDAARKKLKDYQKKKSESIPQENLSTALQAQLSQAYQDPSRVQYQDQDDSEQLQYNHTYPTIQDQSVSGEPLANIQYPLQGQVLLDCTNQGSPTVEGESQYSLQDYEIYCEELHQQINYLNTTLTTCNEQISQLSGEKADLLFQLQRIEEEYKSNPVSQSITELAEAKQEIAKLTQDLIQLQQSDAYQKNTIARLEHSILNLESFEKQRLEDCEKLSQDYPANFQLLLGEKDQIIANLKQLLEIEQNKYQEASKKLEKQEYQLVEYQESSKREHEQLDQLKCQIQSMNDSKNINDVLEQENNKLLTNFQALEKQNLDLVKQLKELTHFRQSFMASSSELEIIKTKRSELQTENVNLVNQLDELRNTCVQLSNDKAKLKLELDTLFESKQVSNQTFLPPSQVQTKQTTELRGESLVEISIQQGLNSDTTYDVEYHEKYQKVVSELEKDIREKDKQIKSLEEDLAKEQKLTTLLAGNSLNLAELEALPDFIEIYHQERKALLGKTSTLAKDKLAQMGVKGTVDPNVRNLTCSLCSDMPLIEL